MDIREITKLNDKLEEDGKDTVEELSKLSVQDFISNYGLNEHKEFANMIIHQARETTTSNQFDPGKIIERIQTVLKQSSRS